MKKAWLTSDGGLFLYADSGIDKNNPFHSPVARLIYGVTKEFGEEYLRYLRRRIYTNYTISGWEFNLIKVCAKRTSFENDFLSVQATSRKIINIGHDIGSNETSARLLESVGKNFSHFESLDLVNHLAKEEGVRFKNQKLHLSPRSVSAAIFTDDGCLLGASVNTNATFQMLHAEVNLFLNLIKNIDVPLPSAARLYTSLKPCRMCASLILDFLGKHSDSMKSLKIFSAKDDIGSWGRHQLLDSILTIEPMLD